MSVREIVFLGTSSQVPTRARGHNAMFIRWDELGILVDPGDGTQRQMAHAGIAASQITHIAITHFHGDHCLGLAGTIQRISLDRVPHTIPIYFPASGRVYFDRLRHASIFYDTSKLEPVAITGAEGELVLCGQTENLTIRASALDHGVDCFGYRFQEADARRMLPEALAKRGVTGRAIRTLIDAGQVEVNGDVVRVEDVSEPRPGQSLAVVMDTRPCPGAKLLAAGVDLLVCESTYLSSHAQEAHDHRHMTAAQAATLASEGGVRRLALTHFSQRYHDLDAFAAEAKPIHADTHVAVDLCSVAVPPRR